MVRQDLRATLFRARSDPDTEILQQEFDLRTCFRLAA